MNNIITVSIYVIGIVFAAGVFFATVNSLKSEIKEMKKNNEREFDSLMKAISKLENNDIQHLYQYVGEIKDTVNQVKIDVSVIKARCKMCDEEYRRRESDRTT